MSEDEVVQLKIQAWNPKKTGPPGPSCLEGNGIRNEEAFCFPNHLEEPSSLLRGLSDPISSRFRRSVNEGGSHVNADNLCRCYLSAEVQ